MGDTEFEVGKSKICVVKGDLTNVETDAVVNAANSSLMGGGGVDGAIHRKGGIEILEECKQIRTTDWPDGLPTGKTVITIGGALKTRFVIHTVGPVWQGGDKGESELLTKAYCNSLRLAVSEGLRTVAFPSISTGAYRYPIEKVSRIALKTVREFLKREHGLDKVVFVLFTEHDLEVYKETARELL